MLSDIDIVEAMCAEDIDISPFKMGNLQPCSYDVMLSTKFAVPLPFKSPVQMNTKTCASDYTFLDVDEYQLDPGEFVLGSTEEVLTLGKGYAAQVEGKSSLGRMGLIVHVTAGFIDPGFSGQITLELYNVSPRPITLAAGSSIGQLVFHKLDTPSVNSYASTGRYNNQEGPTISKGV